MTSADRFFMCPPKFYGVQYVINPWMEGNVGRAQSHSAKEQWDNLRAVVEARASVELIEPAEDLPDMPFTANAGLVWEDMFIPSRFRFRQRHPETERFVPWFREHGYRIVELPGQGTFEGEGDALFQPGERLLWGGYGVRTSLQSYRDLAQVLEMEVIPLRLVDERFYHLDTCLCPLPGGRLLYYPDAFEREAVEAIVSRIPAEKRFEVGAADASNFACNSIEIDGAFITNFAGEQLRRRLTEWGFEVIVCPLSEFILAGGSAKCLALRLTHADVPSADGPSADGPAEPASIVCDRVVEIQGHLLDTGQMGELLEYVTQAGCTFEIEEFRPGLRQDQDSWARIRVVGPSPERLDRVLGRLLQMGAHIADAEVDARLELVERSGVAPHDFYSTTIFPTDVRVDGGWIRARGQRMDAMLVVEDATDGPTVRCALLRDLGVGDRVVCGVEGIRIQTAQPAKEGGSFEFMSSGISSERRVELAVDQIAWEMRRIRERRGKIVVVAGPVVIHTGGGAYLARLIRDGYVQVLLGGNAIAVHDIEQALFGTSLGIDLKRGTGVKEGHQHHLRAINRMAACGGIAGAVERGVLRSGVMYECVKQGVPFALAGSIRDDGPLPETEMDLIAAQREYAQLLEGADMILMLASMLHSIGVGNMTPAGVRLICVDIHPAVITKLADRGSMESTGVVTDVGLFLNLLSARLASAS